MTDPKLTTSAGRTEHRREIARRARDGGRSRLFYVAAGRSDVLGAHRSWMAGVKHGSETALTFSGQVASHAAKTGKEAMFVTDRKGVDEVAGGVRFAHMPKQARAGWRWHLEELRHALALARLAASFRADVALVDSGVTHYFALLAFSLRGIRVVPVLHNARWPDGHPPTGLVRRVVRMLDDIYLRLFAHGVLSASPACSRQLPRGVRVEEFRAQFIADEFVSLPPPVPSRPMKVLFAGRAEADKGLLDIAEMARLTEASHPGLLEWHVCGDGSDLPRLRAMAVDLPSVRIHGWCAPDRLRALRGESHIPIAPTRPQFAEGLAMTAVESILAGRPLVTSPVVPALELLRPACEEAIPGDAASHAAAVVRLASDHALWERRRAACATVARDFTDPRRGLTAAIGRLLDGKSRAA